MQVLPFTLRIQKQIFKGNFGAFDEWLRDRLAAGIYNPVLQKNLSMFQDVISQNAKNLCERNLGFATLRKLGPSNRMLNLHENYACGLFI